MSAECQITTRTLSTIQQVAAESDEVMGKLGMDAEELVMMMLNNGTELERLSGMVYNPLTSRWSLSSDTAVNYIAAFQRRVPSSSVPVIESEPPVR